MGDWQITGALSRLLRADNPGPMTLTGTNSYVLAAPDAKTIVVVDPGPLMEDHLGTLADCGTVELILITHRHADHTGGSARLHELTGAPVRAFHADFCHAGDPLLDGESISAAGVEIKVLATPGHTSDSLCFFLKHDGEHGAVLTGDTILGEGTTVLDFPDGQLIDYLTSLEKLRVLGSTTGPVTVLPAHGPTLPDLASRAGAYIAHRQQRLGQVRAGVELLRQRNGSEPDAAAVTALVYADVPAAVQGAALLSVQAQLEYLSH